MASRGTAVVTGAAGGMGSAFATALATQGYNLILSDREEAPLKTLARQIEKTHGVAATAVAADLSDRTDLTALADAIAARGDVTFLVNNAGFGNPGPFAESDLAKNVTMIDVHVVASVWLCRAALPGMLAKGTGTIVNMASLGGFPAGRGDVTYSSTKRYLIHFSKGLQAEVKGLGIRVQALCPGLTRTGFHDSAAYDALTRGVPGFLWMDPTAVAAASLAALRGRKVVCIPGFRNRILLLLMYFPIIIRIIHAVVRRLS